MKFGIFSRLFPLTIVVIAMISGISTTAFGQTSPIDPTDVPVKNITDVKFEVKPNDSKAEENRSAQTGELAAFNSESIKPPFVVFNSFSDLRKELSVKPFRKNEMKAAPMPRKQSGSGNDGWHFAFAPYLYMPALSGTVGARGRTLEIDMSIGDVLKKFDIGVMGAFEARKGRLVIMSDLFWTKLSEEENTPGGLYSTAKIGVNMFIFDPEIGYRVMDSDGGSLDILAGVRIWSVENNLNVTTGRLPGFDVSQRKSWAAPVVGVHSVTNLTPKFFLSGKFDIGGAGIGADLTTQFYAGVGYRLTPNIALVGGYRYLQVDYDDSEGFLFDTKMNGILFGAKFSF